MKISGCEARDSDFLTAGRAWLKEVGRVLGPLQVTRGGPILMVQVENEYGFYGDDVQYMGEMRQALLDAGFDVPLFACNPPYALRKGLRDDLFNVVNFGKDPAGGFKALREIQPAGPVDVRRVLSRAGSTPGDFRTIMGDTPQYLTDLEYMLEKQRVIQHLHGPRRARRSACGRERIGRSSPTPPATTTTHRSARLAGSARSSISPVI